MNKVNETLIRYTEAINDLNVQIKLPALATPLNTQQEYNRRKRMEQTHKEPTKHVAGLKKMVKQLELEKRYVIKGINLVIDTIKTMDIPNNIKEQIYKELGDVQEEKRED